MTKRKKCAVPKARRKFGKSFFTKKKSTKSKTEAKKTAASAKAQGKKARVVTNACKVYTVYVK